MKAKSRFILIMILTIATVAGVYLICRRHGEGTRIKSLSAFETGGLSPRYNEYKVYRENGDYFISFTDHRKETQPEIYPITKDEFLRTVNKKYLDSERFEKQVKIKEGSTSDGIYHRSVIEYSDGTVKELLESPHLSDCMILLDQKRIEAGAAPELDPELYRLKTAWLDICYKYRVKDSNISIIKKDEKGNWDTDSNDNRHVYRGDNSDVTPLQAVTVIDYNPDGSGKDTLYQFRNEETGYGFDIFVRTDDFLTRDLMFRELENALNDPDFDSTSGHTYVLVRIVLLLLIEGLLVLVYIRLCKAAAAKGFKLSGIKLTGKKIRIAAIGVAAAAIVLGCIFYLKKGNAYLDEGSGVLTLKGRVSREDILAFSENQKVYSVVAEKGAVLPEDCHELFAGLSEDKDRMKRTYYWAALDTVDLSKADASRVKNMSKMFSKCRMLESVNMTGLNTSNVSDMSGMFTGDIMLKSLDVSGMKTSKVADMSDMFYFCENLESIDMSGWDTKNLKNMSRMFSECRYLTSIDLSGFDTSNVTTMHSLFSGCMSCAEFNFSGLNTSNVTDTEYMFDRCYEVDVLDLSSFDTSNVEKMEFMFGDMRDIETIYVSDKWNTDKVPSGTRVFTSDYHLTGGSGTEFTYSDNWSTSDVSFARIDSAEAPGYFTGK